MDPRIREDDGTEARACAERTVIPVPASFLHLHRSCPCVIPAEAGIHPRDLKNGGACNQGHCTCEAEESQHGGQQDDAGDAPVVCAKAFSQQ